MEELQNAPPQPLRQAKQERSKILVQSVREATLLLIDELGADAVTTVKIAGRAGISPGSLYRYYPNKQAIFTDIYQSELSRLDQRLISYASKDLTTESLECIIRTTLELTHNFYAELISLHSGFFISYYQNFDFTQRKSPEGQQSWRAVGNQWWVSVLKQNRHRLRVDDVEAAAIFLMDLTTGFFHRKIEMEPSALQEMIIIDQLEDVFLRYLLVD